MPVPFEDLYQQPTLSNVKEIVLQVAREAGLPVDNWILGDPSERWIEINGRTVHLFGTGVTTQAVRGFFLDLATDPGDPGDLSADQTPRPGWLSALGSSWYGVERGGLVSATGSVTITNAGSTATSPIKPFDLTFERSTEGPDGGRPTYRNSADPSIYTGIGGTITLAPGASLTIPIVAEQPGTYSSAAAAQITTVTTQSFGTLNGSNESPVLGADREDPDLYRARCRTAADKLSSGGPGNAYRYAANTARDGSPLQRFDGSGPVGITETYVSRSSSTGKVTLYFRDPDGPADAIDVSSANANITGIPLGVITDPLGVLPDTVTPLPTVTDPNTGGPGGAAAIAVEFTLAGTGKIKQVVGGLTGLNLIAAAQGAIALHMAAQFSGYPIGGVDQVSGAGVIYTDDLECDIRDSYAGLYAIGLTLPAGASTAIPEGNVGVLVGHAVTAAVSATGLIKITSEGHGLITGNVVQIYGVLGTVEANGTWTVTRIDDDLFTLDGSTFTNAYTSGGVISRIILTVVT